MEPRGPESVKNTLIILWTLQPQRIPLQKKTGTKTKQARTMSGLPVLDKLVVNYLPQMSDW